MIITREKGMRMWGGGSGNTSVSGASSGGGFSLTVAEGEGTGNAYTDFTYESGTLTLNKATEFVTVDFFNKLFTAYDANGNVIAPNNTTPTLDNIKFKAGAWTEQYLSALGQNSSGGGGGGGGDVSSIIFDTSISYHTGTPVYTATDGVIHLPPYPTSVTWANVTNKPSWIGSSKPTYSLSEISGTDDLQAIEGLTGTSGLLKKTAANTWTLDTNTYALASDVYSSSASRTKNYVLAAPSTANGAATFRKLVASDIPDLSSTYATDARADTLEGYFNTGGVAKVAAKLNTGTTTYTAWGQTYWSSGVPQSISGNMTSVGSITPSANGNALGTTSARFNIYGTSGNFSGNVSISGTLGVTGATTLSSTLSVAGGITLTTTKKIYFGDTSHYLELNSTGFHFSHGVYSDSFVSALGANSSGGGGGGIDLDAMWAELQGNTGTYENAKINWNHIPLATSTTAGAIKVGSTLAISSGVLNQKSGIATAGTYRSVTVDTYGRVTAGTNPTTLSGYGVLDDADGRYYALYGGTRLNVSLSSTNTVDLNDVVGIGNYYCGASADAQYINNKPGSLNHAFRLWVFSSTGVNASYLRQRFQNYDRDDVFERISSNGGTSWGDWILVQDNLANYALASSLNNYLPLSGGQMTGHLTWKDTTALPRTTTPLFMLTMDRFADGGTTRYANLEDVTVGKATTLETSRTIWGQSFDGSANITGALSSVTSITMSSHINMNNNTSIRSKDTDGTTRAIVSYNSSNHLYLGYDVPASGGSTFICGTNIGFRTNGTDTANQAMYITSGQNVGIGTDTPGYKLGVVGNIGISGDIYLHNTGTIYAKDSTDTDRSILTFTSSNQLILGSGVPAAGGTTYIMGNIIDIRAGGAAASNRTIYITAAQNVGIGTTNPSQKLHVVGNILASGEVTASSDERKKNIISNTKFNVKDIASARSIIYEWKDRKDKIHGGSIAQDWIGKADSFLSQDNDGWYSINYGALALCSAITIAREVLKHSDEIDRLKQEVSYLKAKVAELEERRVA